MQCTKEVRESNVNIKVCNLCVHNLCVHNLCVYNLCVYNLCVHNLCSPLTADDSQPKTHSRSSRSLSVTVSSRDTPS